MAAKEFRYCRCCKHWDGPPWPSPTPGLCAAGISEFSNPLNLTIYETGVYVLGGEVFGVDRLTYPGFTCAEWEQNPDRLKP